jgi:hypothetical protein
MIRKQYIPTHNKTEPSGGDKAKFQAEILALSTMCSKIIKAFFRFRNILTKYLTVIIKPVTTAGYSKVKPSINDSEKVGKLFNS